jgi:hypothetical protein
LTAAESEENLPKPKKLPPVPDPEQSRELTPEEREELRKKIEEGEKEDPNIYPVF